MKKNVWMMIILPSCLFVLPASASETALNIFTTLHQIGVVSEGAAGHTINGVDMMDCQKKTDSGNITFTCDASVSVGDGTQAFKADGQNAQILFEALEPLTGTDCLKGTCFVSVQQLSCSQANEADWDPGQAPAPAERTNCHVLVEKNI